MKFFRYCFVFIFVVLFTTGCLSSDQTSSNSEDLSKLNVYTTVYPFQFAVERIGRETVDAQTIYPPGADSHTYEPSTKEMTRIADGDTFI